MPAKDYIDNARRLADRANAVSLVLFAGLLISVLADFGPKLATFRDTALAERAQKHHERTQAATLLESENLKRLRDAVDRLTKEKDKRAKTSRSEEELQQVTTHLENAKESLDRAERAYRRATETTAALSVVRDAQRRAAQDVKLKGFGFELGVRGNWASIVWMLLLLLGLVNLCIARFGVAGELRAGGKEGEETLEAFRVPLWLYPISRSSRAKSNALDLHDTLTLAVAVLAVCCIVAAFWMARLTLVAPVFFAASHEEEGVIASIAVGCLTAAIVVAASMWAIPVRLAGSSDGSGDRRVVRRRLLVALPIFAVACSAVAVPLPIRKLFQRTILNPRQRRRVHQAAIPPGFYAHKRTQKIHYVPLEGRAKSLRGANMADFVPVDPATLTAAHRPFVHTKALVAYARQMVRNLRPPPQKKIDPHSHNIPAPRRARPEDEAAAALMADILNNRDSRPQILVTKTDSTESAQGQDRGRPRRRGTSARSHGKRRRRSSDRRNNAHSVNPPRQPIQICDLLARLAARTQNPQHLETALGHLTMLRWKNERGHTVSFAERAQQIKEGMNSRLTAKSRFTIRRFEAILRQMDETSERRKRESELLELLKAHSSVPDDTTRLEQSISRRSRSWSSKFWMSDYNQKARLIRNRGKRKRAQAKHL